MLRSQFLCKYVKDKTVLDIGFLGNRKINGDYSWIFGWLQKVSKEVYGIDIDKNKIEELRKKGYNVYYDDANNLNEILKLNKKFDVIFLGDVICYVHNLLNLFLKLDKILKKNGYLIITLHNPVSLWTIYYNLFKGKEMMLDTVGTYTPSDIKNLISTIFGNKYTIKKTKFFINDENFNKISFFSKIIFKIYPRLRPNFGIVFQKKWR